MLKFKRHHGIIAAVAGLFVLAWALWTFFSPPRRDLPAHADGTGETQRALPPSLAS